MATITPVSVDTAGEQVTLVAASAGGDTIADASGATLIIANGSASPITVTLTGVVTCSQGALHDKTYTVAANKTDHIKIAAQCVDKTTGDCAVSYSAVTTVTVGATI